MQRSQYIDFLDISEWYSKAARDIVIYFDSWEDLKLKVASTDIVAMRDKSIAYALQHQNEMLRRWKEVFEISGMVKTDAI